MLVFVIRRLLISIGVLLVATFIMFTLTATSGDPLETLYGVQNPVDRANRIRARTEILHLDQSIPLRWAHWLWGVLGYVLPGVKGTLGENVTAQPVGPLLQQAVGASLKLVLAATLVAIVTGVTVGVVSALRQYTAFDYSITFMSFLFFSLPIFWAAILLKEFGAIKFNTWLADPRVTLPWLIGLAVLSGLTWSALLGGREWPRRLLVFGVALVATAGILTALSSDRWFAHPGLGLVGVAVLGLAAAVGIAALVSGLGTRPVLYSALAAAVVGLVVYQVTLPVLATPSWLGLIGLFVGTLVLGGVAGALLGGIYRASAVRAGVLSAAVVGALGFLDWVLVSWPSYSASVLGRPIATIGSNTPNFSGDLWHGFLDAFTHLILPSIALVLISFAQYTRYTRGSMLETMSQDYVRTARSKGLTERAVIVRHAFRNALIPVTTLMAIDIGAVLGGAIITENVFGWQGMGQLFLSGLNAVDPAPVMAFFLVTASAVLVFNLISDTLYAYLDPRIRLS